MRMYTFFLTLAVGPISIECSSHSPRYPHGGQDPGPPTPPAAGEPHSPNWTPTDEPLCRARTRSPASRRYSIEMLGYPLDELGYVRLISRTNPNIRFQFRNYVFPAGIGISWRGDGKSFSAVPAQEHIVLSESDGDIFAILAYTGVLRGIHRTKRGYPRMKMNMLSGVIDNLTPDDIKDCPVGKRNPIFPQSFIKAFSNHDSLQFKWNPSGERNPGPSYTARQHSPDCSPTPEESVIRARSDSPPGKPPSDQVLGYSMEQLGYLRLVPCTNHNQQFEFRRYVFPRDKPIRMRIYEKKYALSPSTEYIVLSTTNGDVCAVLHHSGTLCGIYRTNPNNSRAKINMMNGAVYNMTENEKRDCPIGRNRVIFPHNFGRTLADSDSLQYSYNSHSERNPGSPPPARQDSSDRARSSPDKPLSDEVLE